MNKTVYARQLDSTQQLSYTLTGTEVNFIDRIAPKWDRALMYFHRWECTKDFKGTFTAKLDGLSKLEFYLTENDSGLYSDNGIFKVPFGNTRIKSEKIEVRILAGYLPLILLGTMRYIITS